MAEEKGELMAEGQISVEKAEEEKVELMAEAQLTAEEQRFVKEFVKIIKTKTGATNFVEREMLAIVAYFVLKNKNLPKKKSNNPEEMADPKIVVRSKRFVLISFNGSLFSIRHDYTFFDSSKGLSRFYISARGFYIGVINMPQSVFQLECADLEIYATDAFALAEEARLEEARLEEKSDAFDGDAFDGDAFDGDAFDDDAFDSDAFGGRTASNATGRTASNAFSGRTASNATGRTASNAFSGRTASNAFSGRTASNM
jgi:hypothetical protein